MAADGKTSIWWNGKQVPYADAKTHVLSHCLHYGSGVFEGIRALLDEAGPGDLPPARAHRAALLRRPRRYKFPMPVTLDR